MSEMTHEESVEELAGVALGSASAAVVDRVRAHTRACPQCASELSGFEAITRELGGLIPQHPINPGRAAGIRSRLLSRANADTDRRPATVQATAASRVKTANPQKAPAASVPIVREAPIGRAGGRSLSAGTLGIVAGLAVLAAVGAVVQMLRANSEANSLRATIQVQPDTVPQPADGQAPDTIDKDKIISAVTGSDVKVIPLTHYGASGAVAKMFWNRESNTWTLVTYSIRQPRSGKVFQVWLATYSGRIAAGTFVPDASGRAILQSENIVGRDALESVSITEEAQGGATTPTGPVVIAGAPQ